MDSHLSRAAPIQRLNADTLSEIFLDVKAERECSDDRRQDPDHWLTPQPPVGTGAAERLSQVCSRWRAVALNLVTLWCSLGFDLSAGPGTLPLIQLYLQRARNAPLEIEITLGMNPRMVGKRHLAKDNLPNPMLPLIWHHSERIHSLRILKRWYGSDFHLHFVPHLPNLESLFLYCYYESGEQTLPRICGLGRASRLHTVALLDSGDKYQLMTDLERSRVRSLCISSIAVPSELNAFSNLTVLTWTRAEPQEWTDMDYVYLPRLLSWVIKFTIRTPPTFLKHFRTPSLEALDIDSYAHPVLLAEFLENSQCALRALFLRRACFRMADLIKSFQMCPSITQLVFEYASPASAITDRTLEAMKARAGHATLLPRLSFLRIAGWYLFSDEALVSMMESRAPAFARTVSPLEAVQVEFTNHRVGEDHLQRLRVLNGVHIFVKCKNEHGDLWPAVTKGTQRHADTCMPKFKF